MNRQQVRNRVLCGCLVLSLIGLPGPQGASADTGQEAIPYQQNVVDQLKDQGYGDVTVRRTWLGRSQIIGLRGGLRREVILNPYTGEILRDFTRPSVQANAGSSGGTSSASGQGVAVPATQPSGASATPSSAAVSTASISRGGKGITSDQIGLSTSAASVGSGAATVGTSLAPSLGTAGGTDGSLPALLDPAGQN